MKVVFIQPAQFLRSKDKTNPYFDPIIKCAGEDWTVWLPQCESSACGYQAEHVRCYGAFQFWSIWFWRAVHIVCPWLSVARVHWLFGKLARPFLRDWAKADIIITITGIFADELAGAFPDKRIVDVQHGVIYSRHNGYFNKDGSVLPQYRAYTNREFWTAGTGYAACFFKNSQNKRWLDGRVKVIGDLLSVSRTRNMVKYDGRCDIIAVSLQFTHDFGREVLQSWADDLCAVFEQIEAAELHKRYSVVMRHHPRFENSYDIGPMMKRFPCLKLTSESTNELIQKAAYHITYMSTSAFEYAAAGVPTLFTASEKNRDAVDMMYGEFGYPIPLDFHQMAKALEDEQELARQGEQVRNWHRRYYKPFDAENCARLLRGEALICV